MNPIFLAGGLDILMPDPGLLIWSVIIFAILWTLLAKFAFKPISKALKDREQSIANSLEQAENARKEMANLNAENEALLRKAQEERSVMLKEAKSTSDKMIAEAREKASEEATKLVENAKREIDNEKKAALAEVKKQVGLMAVDISEKILKRELAEKSAQEQYVAQLVEEAAV